MGAYDLTGRGAIKNKAAVVFALGAFVLSSTSCMTYSTRRVATTADYPSSKARILKVDTASGTAYTFPESAPGRLLGDKIAGTATFFGKGVEIEGPFAGIKKRADGTIYEIIDREGRIYSVQKVVSAGEDKMTVLVTGRYSEWVSIPLSEIRSVQLKKLNVIATLVMVAGGGFMGLLGLMLAFGNTMY